MLILIKQNESAVLSRIYIFYLSSQMRVDLERWNFARSLPIIPVQNKLAYDFPVSQRTNSLNVMSYEFLIRFYLNRF